MSRRLTSALGVAAGCAVVVGLLAAAGQRPSARLGAVVLQRAQGAFRLAVAGVSATRGAQEAPVGGPPAGSGGVIPLETVPFDQLSEWELDLLTTPDS